jgi:N-acetylmuramoyl-L-alanine amidase
MPKAPTLVVVHRAAVSARVAEYFHSPGDGRRVSAHFAWSPRPDGYVQCVSLRREAHHAGGSVWQGDRRLNDNSIGFELPGRMGTQLSGHVRRRTRELLEHLAREMPSIVACIGHSDCDPENRSDPGKEFPWVEIVSGLGWRCPHLG